eukprot:115605-Amphidinium_carterae.1
MVVEQLWLLSHLPVSRSVHDAKVVRSPNPAETASQSWVPTMLRIALSSGSHFPFDAEFVCHLPV